MSDPEEPEKFSLLKKKRIRTVARQHILSHVLNQRIYDAFSVSPDRSESLSDPQVEIKTCLTYRRCDGEILADPF